MRSWLEAPGRDAATAAQPLQAQGVAVDNDARQLLELVVKTIVETVIVTAGENSRHEEGPEDG